MINKKLKTLLTTGILTLGLCTGCGNNNEKLTALQEKYDNSQKMVEQYKKDNEKIKEQNKKLEIENNTLKKKTDNKTEPKKETTKSKLNNTNSNNKSKHAVTTKNTTKNKDNKNTNSTGQDCDVCGKFVPMSDMCNCDGGMHHRECKHKIYSCPQCGHTTTANPDNLNFSCGWCGYPDDDLRTSCCRFCGKEVTRDNQYGECRDVCQSCAEKRYE